MIRKDPVTLLALSLLALLLGGCGAGSSATTASRSVVTSNAEPTPSQRAQPSPSATTRPQFILQADAICGRVNVEISAIKAKSTSAAEVIRVVPGTLSIERSGTAALERLAPPASLVRDWQRMMSYRRALAGDLAELLAMAKKNDGTSVNLLGASKKRAHAGLAAVAKADGFKACGKVGRVG